MMRTDLSRALDDCLKRLQTGDSVEACLVAYPHLRGQLKPLLFTAASISAAPDVTPSDEFRRVSKARLMSKLRIEAVRTRATEPHRQANASGILVTILRRLAAGFAKPRTLAIPVTLLLLLAIGGSLSVIVSLGLPSTPTVLASQCTLSVLSGDVEFQIPGMSTWHKADDGIVLKAGIRLKTAADSHALLTFFEGSSIKLEPGTDIEIQRLESIEGQSTNIVLKQWVGTTWSRVVKQLDRGVHYEIQTPSATALVRGTLFETEVSETADTTVRTVQGVVTVSAQNEEVYLPAGLQTSVTYGEAPSAPQPIPPTDSELIISVSAPAVASVSDPTGSSIGYLPGGLSFNQITGAHSTPPLEGTQVITIPGPVSGDYAIALRCIAAGAIQFNAQYFYEGQQVFTYDSMYHAITDSGWLIPLHLELEGGQLISATVGDIAPLGEQTPEIIVTPTPGEKSTPTPSQTNVPTQSPDIGDEYTLVILSGTGGSVTDPGQGVFFYPAGTVVDLFAVPAKGWKFANWTGTVADPSSPATSITMLQSEVITANFVPRR